jgi:hypothetical protein
MLTRRGFVLRTAALALTTTTLAACSCGPSAEDAARRLRRPGTANTSDRALLLRELVRYATLAPSSHNTQCWMFRLQEQLITIESDLSRRCPVVDPDDHHMFVSLGCASENLVHAALANGLHADATFDPTGTGSVVVRLEATKAVASSLFKAIAERQCTRGDYDGKSLTRDELRLLEQAGSGRCADDRPTGSRRDRRQRPLSTGRRHWAPEHSQSCSDLPARAPSAEW